MPSLIKCRACGNSITIPGVNFYGDKWLCITCARNEETQKDTVFVTLPYDPPKESWQDRCKRLAKSLAPIELKCKGRGVFKLRRYPEPKLITWQPSND